MNLSKIALFAGLMLSLNAGAQSSLSEQYSAARESNRELADARERAKNEPYRRQAAAAGLKDLVEKMRTTLAKEGLMITEAELSQAQTESGAEVRYRSVNHWEYAAATSQYLVVTYKVGPKICRVSGTVTTSNAPPSGLRAFVGDPPKIEVEAEGCINPS